jgi:hypothetical protein
MATTTFDNLITFSRGSNATVTGPNGLIQWAPNNLLTNSQDFESANWGKTGLGTGSAPVVTSNVAVAPDGTTTADLVAFNRGAGNAIGDRSTLSQLPTILNGYAYAATIYIKAATAGDIGKQLAFRGVAGVGYQVVTLTADWVRISTVETSTGTAGNFELASRGTVSADNQVSAHLWGAQLELGSTATTYNNTSVRNLLGFSEAFDNAAWTKSGASIVTGAQANPVNGLFNAQKLMENTAAATQHYVARSVTALISNTPITLSVYAKAGERRYIALLEGASNKGQYFDLQTGTVGSVLTAAPTSASITAIGNGWYRCSITIPVLSTTASLEVYLSNSGASISYTGDGNSGVYIYGAQLSNSASLDPYVPTPGAAPSSTAYYGPRFDYDPVTLLPRGLLIEEQRTNLHVQSEAFSSPWTTTRASVVSAAVQAPSGANSVIAFTEDATNSASHELYQNTTKAASAITYTYSLYVKKAGRDWICVTIWDNSANGNRFWFNVNTGAKGSTTTFGTPFTSAAYDIVAAPAGFYRIFVTLTSNTATNLAVTLYSTNADSSIAPATALNAAGLYVYGSQLETGAFATSYIPTIASTVTRSADNATITGSLFSQWYNQAAGTFVANFVPYIVSGGSGGVFSANSGSASNRIDLRRDGFSLIDVAGVRQADLSVAGMTANVSNRLSVAYEVNNFALVRNGGSPTVDTSGTVPTVNLLQIGGLDNSPSLALNGHIRSISYVPVRAADFQLQQVTT